MEEQKGGCGGGGDLSFFPLELLQEICLFLDLKDWGSLLRTDKFCSSLIDDSLCRKFCIQRFPSLMHVIKDRFAPPPLSLFPHNLRYRMKYILIK